MANASRSESTARLSAFIIATETPFAFPASLAPSFFVISICIVHPLQNPASPFPARPLCGVCWHGGDILDLPDPKAAPGKCPDCCLRPGSGSLGGMAPWRAHADVYPNNPALLCLLRCPERCLHCCIGRALLPGVLDDHAAASL